MLVASKKKADQQFIPYVDYHHDTKDAKGEARKVVSSVGFYEQERRKILKKGGYGDVLKKEFVETEDENNFKLTPYSGKTLIISIKNSKYTTSNCPATEQDKIKYSDAYEAFLNHKAQEEQKDIAIREMKKQIEALEQEKFDKEGKEKAKSK